MLQIKKVTKRVERIGGSRIRGPMVVDEDTVVSSNTF